GNDHIIHERAVVVEIGTQHKPGEQALCTFHRLDDKAALARYQWHALGPACRNVDHSQGLDEGPGHRRAAVRHHVDLAEPGCRIVPVVECPDRNLPTDRGVETDTPAFAARGRDLGVDQLT